MWDLHHYAQGSFPALQLWYETKHRGRRYKVPSLKKAPKGNGIAEVRWFDVDIFYNCAPIDRFRSYAAEMWNRFRHPDNEATH